MPEFSNKVGDLIVPALGLQNQSLSTHGPLQIFSISLRSNYYLENLPQNSNQINKISLVFFFQGFVSFLCLECKTLMCY